VLKKGVGICAQTHLEVKFYFETFSNEKTLSYEVIQNWCTNTLVKENIIQLTHYVCKVLKCQKIAKKVAKNTYMSKPPSTKMLLNHS